MNGRRIHQSDVDAAVRKVEYVLLPDGRTTVCMITMQNGYTVTGESSCVDAANYDQSIGEQIARGNAYAKVWPLLGYMLRDELHRATQAGTVHLIIGGEEDKAAFIARICHEVNRALCIAFGDDSQPEWVNAPEWQRGSAIAGVRFHMANPNAGPEASHASWLEQKFREGWKYGPVKAPAKLEHPCMRPFDQLPKEQQAKDYLFRAVVHALV